MIFGYLSRKLDTRARAALIPILLLLAAGMASRMARGVPQANGQIAIEPLMDVNTVGTSVLYMANLPLDTNVLFHTVMATQMPFVGRG